MQRSEQSDESGQKVASHRFTLLELLFWMTGVAVLLASLQIPLLAIFVFFVFGLFVLARLETFLPQIYVVMVAVLLSVVGIIAGGFWLIYTYAPI